MVYIVRAESNLIIKFINISSLLLRLIMLWMCSNNSTQMTQILKVTQFPLPPSMGVSMLISISSICVKSLFHTDLLARRTEVVDKLHEFEEAMDPILAMLGDPEVSQLIESGK